MIRDRDRFRTLASRERGSVTVESVILFPLALLLIFGAIQGGLYYYARSIATAAAEQGLQAARTEQGSAASGGASAQQFLTGGGSKGLLTDITVDPTRTATTAAVTVTGAVPSLIPGLTLTVSQIAAGAVERVTTRTGATAPAGAP